MSLVGRNSVLVVMVLLESEEEFIRAGRWDFFEDDACDVRGRQAGQLLGESFPCFQGGALKWLHGIESQGVRAGVEKKCVRM